MASLLNGAGELFPETELVYVTTFPRYVNKSCDKNGHMTKSEACGLDSVRQDMDRDLKEVMMDSARGMKFVELWDLLGLEKDVTVTEMRKIGVIEGDGVHLTTRACRVTAVSLCTRIREMVSKVEEQRRPELGDMMMRR
jgi:hypothetical protein